MLWDGSTALFCTERMGRNWYRPALIKYKKKTGTKHKQEAFENGGKKVLKCIGVYFHKSTTYLA